MRVVVGASRERASALGSHGCERYMSGLRGEVAGQAAADPGSMQGPHGMAIWGDVRAVGRGWGWGWDPGLVLLIIIGREGVGDGG